MSLYFKGTVLPVYNCLKVLWLDTPWLTHQAQVIKKITIYPFKLQQGLTFIKCLILNPFEFTASIITAESKWLNTF